jgi:hypothetical protein
VPGLPSLVLLGDETSAELAAQERRGDALDSKAGVVLGFAGVLVPLSLASLHGTLAHIGAAFAAVAALCCCAAFVPRSYPTLALPQLRDRYLAAEEEFTRLRLLDTRIAMYQRTQKLLTFKALMVTAATLALGAAVILTVIGGIVE